MYPPTRNVSDVCEVGHIWMRGCLPGRSCYKSHLSRPFLVTGKCEFLQQETQTQKKEHTFLQIWAKVCLKPSALHKICTMSLCQASSLTHVCSGLLTCYYYISINFIFFSPSINLSLSLSQPSSWPVVSEVITRSFRPWSWRPGTLHQPLFSRSIPVD